MSKHGFRKKSYGGNGLASCHVLSSRRRDNRQFYLRGNNNINHSPLSPQKMVKYDLIAFLTGLFFILNLCCLIAPSIVN